MSSSAAADEQAEPMSDYIPLDPKAERALGLIGWFLLLGLLITVVGLGVWITADPVLRYSIKFSSHGGESFEIWAGGESLGMSPLTLGPHQLERLLENLGEDVNSVGTPQVSGSVGLGGTFGRASADYNITQRLFLKKAQGQPNRVEYLMTILKDNGRMPPSRALRFWILDEHGASARLERLDWKGSELGRNAYLCELSLELFPQ